MHTVGIYKHVGIAIEGIDSSTKEAKLRKCNIDFAPVTMFDAVVSVAASVITSLLVISGDIEENPGPGGR